MEGRVARIALDAKKNNEAQSDVNTTFDGSTYAILKVGHFQQNATGSSRDHCWRLEANIPTPFLALCRCQRCQSCLHALPDGLRVQGGDIVCEHTPEAQTDAVSPAFATASAVANSPRAVAASSDTP